MQGTQGHGASQGPPAARSIPRSQADPAGRHRGIRHHRASRSAARRWSTATAWASARPRSATSWPSSRQPGYLTHPHTSAGRVPTDAGYRLYVESIAPQMSLAPVERLMIRHQFGQVEFASEQWFRLAAATIAGVDACGRPRHAGQAALVPAAPRRSRRDQLADGEPRRRPCRGLGQAGARPARRAVRAGRPRRRRRLLNAQLGGAVGDGRSRVASRRSQRSRMRRR